MPNDGSHPLSEALGDTAQKGAALAAVVMQVLAERQRMATPYGGTPSERALRAAEQVAATNRPGLGPGRQQDYLETKRLWQPALEPGFGRVDPALATKMWLDSGRYLDRYPSAREAFELAERRMRQLDPGFMDRVQSKTLAGVGPAVALEAAAREQLQLPAGRSVEAQLAAAELELERLRREYANAMNEATYDYEAERLAGGRPDLITPPSDQDLVRAEARVDQLQNQLDQGHPDVDHVYLREGLHSGPDTARLVTKVMEVTTGESWDEDEVRRRLAANPDQQVAERSYSLEAFHPAHGPVEDHPQHQGSYAALHEAAGEAALLEDDGYRVQIVDDAAGRLVPRSEWEGPELASAQAQAQGRALEGLSADERLAGQQSLGTAVDRPATPADERVEGLTNSVERFQLSEVAHANAAHLVAASYPQTLETKLEAAGNHPIPAVSKPTLQPTRQPRRTL